MAEPSCFIRGKEFHVKVKNDFAKNNKGGLLGFEETIKLLNSKKGRMDIIITDLGNL